MERQTVEQQNLNAGNWLRGSIGAIELNGIYTARLLPDFFPLHYKDINLEWFRNIKFSLKKRLLDLPKHSSLNLLNLEQKVLTMKH